MSIVLLILGVVLVLLMAYGAIVCSPLYECMPFWFSRDEWKVWKQCYNDSVESGYSETYTYEGKTYLEKHYYFSNGKYEALVFKITNRPMECAIFDRESRDCVFCSFWKHHSNKLMEKLLQIDIPNKTFE